MLTRPQCAARFARRSKNCAASGKRTSRPDGGSAPKATVPEWNKKPETGSPLQQILSIKHQTAEGIITFSEGSDNFPR